MKANRCQWLTISGIALLLAAIAFKKYFPETFGRSTPLIWSCGAIASALFAWSLFLALHSLFRETARPWLRFLDVFLNLLALTYLFGSLAGEYFLFTKVESNLRLSTEAMLPKLLERSRTAETEPQRMLMAQRAYQFCGVDVAYRRDDGTYVEYSPTAADIAYWQHFETDQNRNAQLKDQIIGGQIRQLPVVLILDAGSFLLTFLGATIWYASRRSKETEPISPS